VAVIGPSGGGKTTLLRLAAGLVWPTAGRVETLGRDTSRLSGAALRELRARLGLLHQDGNLVRELRVAHNVAMGRLGRWSALRALWNLLVPQETERVRAALRAVELEERLWDLPDTLSGGQQQRVAVARLLVQEPELILADEPAAALDPRLGREVLGLLLDASRERGAALVVSLHTLELLDAGFERVLALREGRLFWQGVPGELTRGVLRELYGAEYRTLHLDEVELRGADGARA
jgi:phosphonate transport system ATP-binding protein